MQLNPEFRRYLWLEISPQRLIAMPAILVAIFFLVSLSGDAGSLGNWSLSIYLLLVLLWGTRLSASSVVSEVRAGTWDWQRMSAVRPWQMTWGKLFGSTVFVWFGALICLGVFLFSLLAVGESAELPRMIFLMLACGMLAHAVSLAASLLWLRRRGVEKRSVVALPQLLGLAVGAYAYIEASGALNLGSNELSVLVWHGWSFDLDRFVLVSLAVFLAWAVLGVYRLMQAELQVRQRPWAWAAFVLFLMVYLSGLPATFTDAFDVPLESLTMRVMLAVWIAVGLAYISYFVFEKDPIAARGLSFALKSGDSRRVLRLLPQWAIVTLITALAALAFIVCVLLLDDTEAFGSILFRMDLRLASVLSTLGLLGFLLRDLAIILYLNLRGGRPDAAALVYLLVLHLLVPGLMAALGAGSLIGLVSPFAHIAWLPMQFFALGPTLTQLPGFMSPNLAQVPWLIALGPLPQVALLLVLLAGRWRRFQADIDKSLAREAV